MKSRGIPFSSILSRRLRIAPNGLRRASVNSPVPFKAMKPSFPRPRCHAPFWFARLPRWIAVDTSVVSTTSSATDFVSRSIQVPTERRGSSRSFLFFWMNASTSLGVTFTAFGMISATAASGKMLTATRLSPSRFPPTRFTVAPSFLLVSSATSVARLRRMVAVTSWATGRGPRPLNGPRANCVGSATSVMRTLIDRAAGLRIIRLAWTARSMPTAPPTRATRAAVLPTRSAALPPAPRTEASMAIWKMSPTGSVEKKSRGSNIIRFAVPKKLPTICVAIGGNWTGPAANPPVGVSPNPGEPSGATGLNCCWSWGTRRWTPVSIPLKGGVKSCSTKPPAVAKTIPDRTFPKPRAPKKKFGMALGKKSSPSASTLVPPRPSGTPACIPATPASLRFVPIPASSIDASSRRSAAKPTVSLT